MPLGRQGVGSVDEAVKVLLGVRARCRWSAHRADCSCWRRPPRPASRWRRRSDLHPPRNLWLGGAGFLAGVLAVLLEWQARRVPVDRLFWGAAGGMLGVALGLGLGTALGAVVPGAGRARARALRAPAGLPGRDGDAGQAATSSRTCRSSSSPRRGGDAGGRQDPRHVGHHRRAHRGRLPDRLPGRARSWCPQFVLRELQQIADSADAAQAQPRASAASTCCQRLQRVPGVQRAHRRPRLPAGARGGPQAHRAGAGPRRQDRHQRLQPEPGRRAARASRCSTSTSWPARSSRWCCPASRCTSTSSRRARRRARAWPISTTAPWWWSSTASGYIGQTVDVDRDHVLQTAAGPHDLRPAWRTRRPRPR